MKTIKVVATIIVSDGKVLATQRGYREMKDGWRGGGIVWGRIRMKVLILLFLNI